MEDILLGIHTRDYEVERSDTEETFVPPEDTTTDMRVNLFVHANLMHYTHPTYYNIARSHLFMIEENIRVDDEDMPPLTGHPRVRARNLVCRDMQNLTFQAPTLQDCKYDTPWDIVKHGTESTPCIVCMENKVQCINLPCAHQNLCITCSRTLENPNTCVVCRAEVNEIKRFY